MSKQPGESKSHLPSKWASAGVGQPLSRIASSRRFFLRSS